MPKKVKDLDPKSRSKKIKGGGLANDVQHLQRDSKRIQDAVVTPVRNAPRTIRHK